MRPTSIAPGKVAGDPEGPFNGVKVFSATRLADRERLGDAVTAWLNDHPEVKVTQVVATQSSDAAFHCAAITVFYWEQDVRRVS